MPLAARRLTSRGAPRRTLHAVLAVAALLATVLQPEASSASLPILASGNLSIVGAVPDVGAIGGELVGDTLYTTSASGLRIYDLDTIDDLPVLRASVPVPTYQNEDLDVAGGIALLSSDFLVLGAGVLTVVDVSDPQLARPLATLRVPAAHTASCIAGCRYAWLGGARGRVHVVDLTDPAAPVVRGSFPVPGSVHDVQVDAEGLAWVSTGGGMFVFEPTADPLAPRPVLALPNGTPGAFENDYILHNMLRRGNTVYVVEEDWDPLSNGLCANDGAFQTGAVSRDANGSLIVRALDRFSIGRGGVGQTDRLPTAPVSCSAHYFDVRPDGLAAVAWYEQGVRLLDVRNPNDLREIGYAIGGGETITTLLRDDLLYAFDTVHGLVVLRVNGGPGAPSVAGPLVTTSPGGTAPRPDPRYGFACRLPAAG